ncbi:MAG: threonylcarbamoyl-AMP synthase [Hyphomicrobiales bacterium]|nr:threonylcarbamoyl-AMP synthase [Hyphomicrobiales bacterium]
MQHHLRQTQLLGTDEGSIARAAQILRDGGLVAFPTETVYGLGADATNGAAVAGIYAAKQRPSFNPLISHVATLDQAREQGHFDEQASRLADALWPGPLTLVVPVAAGCRVSDLARAGLDTIALRIPAHPVAQALLQATERPVAAPSANLSGTVSPTTARHVMDGLSGRIDAVVDAGPCSVGLESTIVACAGGRPRILRPGGVPREAIEQLVGPLAEAAQADAPLLAPGMLASHYAPNARMRLEALDTVPGEAVLDFSGQLSAFAARAHAYADLSPDGDLARAAANLFATMRELDATGASAIAVAPVPRSGLGEAINDRLTRAAADR